MLKFFLFINFPTKCHLYMSLSMWNHPKCCFIYFFFVCFKLFCLFKEEVMTLERILLQTIKFDLQVDHPYGHLLKYAKSLKGILYNFS